MQNQMEKNMEHDMEVYMGGFPKIRGTSFWGPHNKDPSILGSILGFPLFWETAI